MMVGSSSLPASCNEVLVQQPTGSAAQPPIQTVDMTITFRQASAFVDYLNSPTVTADLGSFVSEVYASRVDYYGKAQTSLEVVLKDKLAWFARWQDWEIKVEPNSLSLAEFAPAQYRLTYRFQYRWVGKRRSDGSQEVLAGTANAVRIIKRTEGRIKIFSENTELVK
jgi:hypothetical protein